MPIPYQKPAPPSDDKRWKIVATRMRRLGDRPEALIEALHAAQEAFGFLDDDALIYVGDTLGVPHSRVFGVATFYSFFTLKPQGEHTCVICTGTACYINGARDLIEALDQHRRQALYLIARKRTIVVFVHILETGRTRAAPATTLITA